MGICDLDLVNLRDIVWSIELLENVTLGRGRASRRKGLLDLWVDLGGSRGWDEVRQVK